MRNPGCTGHGWVHRRHDVADIAHVRGSGAMARLGAFFGTEQHLGILDEKLLQVAIILQGHISGQGVDFHPGADGHGPRPEGAVHL